MQIFQHKGWALDRFGRSVELVQLGAASKRLLSRHEMLPYGKTGKNSSIIFINGGLTINVMGLYVIYDEIYLVLIQFVSVFSQLRGFVDGEPCTAS